MDIKKKILLGDTDIISKNNEDLFINLSLNSSFKEVISDKYENVFDVDKQFKKERNSSRNFKVYGTIDATITDCDNLSMQIFSTSGATGLSDLIMTISSTGLVYEEKNVYGKKRGKYIVTLDEYDKDFIYIKIPSNNINYKDQIYVQQLVFKDTAGTFIEYGTQTIDVDDNGNIIEISNDFYFMFNKHWIKKSLSIVEEKPAKVFINSNENSSNTNEFNVPADRIGIEISLDKPSPFGLERVDLTIVSSTLNGDEIIIVDTGNTVYPLPATISFIPGQQSQQLFFYSPLDNIQEFLENVVLGLDNFVNVNTGTTLQHTVFVADTTPRNKIKLNFQDVYQNRNYFTGRVYVQQAGTSQTRFSYGMPSVLRNGLFFEGTPMEFYPSDNYILKIKNVGTNTIMPINNRLGITEEKIFLANDELAFNITQEYVSTTKHSIVLTFKNLDAPTTGTTYYAYNDGLRLNGIPLVRYGYNFKVSYKNFLAILTQTVMPGSFSILDGWSYTSFETPFDLVANPTALTLTLTSKNSGTRLDLFSYGILPDIFNIDDDLFDTIGVKAEVEQEFIYDAQKPLEIELGANFNNNLEGKYQFRIDKRGYDAMSFTNSPIPASANPDSYYLVSGLNTILRNWDDSTSKAVYTHDNVTSNWGINAYAANPTFGNYKKGDVYINGMLLLANQYFSNTTIYSSNPQGGTALNQSHAINSSGDFSHDFLPSPISVIPETNEELSPNDIAQVGYLGIGQVNNTTGNFTPRTFEFRTGTTVPYNLYTIKNFNTHGQWEWDTYATTRSVNGIPGTNYAPSNPNIGLKLRTYFQDGDSTKGITDQGLNGITPVSSGEFTKLNNVFSTQGYNFMILDFIKLTAKTPGVPFEFKNFQEVKYVGGPNDGEEFSHNSMIYIEDTPNQKAGISINKANNYMGGFSVIHP